MTIKRVPFKFDPVPGRQLAKLEDSSRLVAVLTWSVLVGEELAKLPMAITELLLSLGPVKAYQFVARQLKRNSTKIRCYGSAFHTWGLRYNGIAFIIYVSAVSGAFSVQLRRDKNSGEAAEMVLKMLQSVIYRPLRRRVPCTKS